MKNPFPATVLGVRAVTKPGSVVPLEDCLDGMRDGARIKSIADHDRAFRLQLVEPLFKVLALR